MLPTLPIKNRDYEKIKRFKTMPNVNKAIVMDVLRRDPETKNFPNGGSITSFSMATSDFWKDKTTSEHKELSE